MTTERIIALNSLGFDCAFNEAREVRSEGSQAAEGGRAELKRAASSASVTTDGQPNKKTRFTEMQMMQWEMRLADLREFRRIHGHCMVPRGYAQNPPLSHWVSKVRREYKRRLNGQKYALSQERMNALDSLGFVWVIGKGYGPKNDLHWNKRLNELREFHEEHGHCRVPLVWPDNPPLGKWVGKVRRTYRDSSNRSSLTAHRVAELNKLGFEWVLGRGVASSAFANWNLQLEELREFHKKHGHCTVPPTYPQNPSFGRWMSKIRRDFEKRANGEDTWLTEEHIAELDNLGFDWVVGKKVKEFGNAHVDQQQQQNVEKEVGLATVPRRGSDQGGVDDLFSNIRCEFKKQENGQESSLTAECIATLNNLGFDWGAVGKKGRDFHLQSRDDQQQQRHGQKEAALETVPRCDSKEEGGIDNETYWI